MSEAITPDEVIGLHQVVKAYGDTVAVAGADLSIRAGEIHALCGHNGAGKSTVVKLLSGQETPDRGLVRVGGTPVQLRNRRAAQAAGIALVDQELSVVAALTVAENLFLGDRESGWWNRPRRMRDRARRMLDDLGLTHVHPDDPLTRLGLGERQLVEIARAVGQRSRLVILDEPTATLTDVESERVYAAVRRVAAAGCAVLFVSHRLGEVLNLCHRVTVMRDGAVVTSRDTAELTVPELIRHMLGDEPEQPDKARAGGRGDRPVLTVEDLGVPGRFDRFSLAAHAGAVYAVAGQLGSGASDVLRGIAGLLPGLTGSIDVAGRAVRPGHPVPATRAGIAFVSNDRKSEGLFLDRSVGANLLATRIPSLVRAGWIRGRSWLRAERRLATVSGIDDTRLDTAVRTLSGGNQQKVFVGRALDRPDVRVLLLDDPTRGVDVGGRAAIHHLLRHAATQGLAVLFSSTEVDELVDLADVVITMHKGAVVARHDGPVSVDQLLREMTHGAAEARPVGGAA